MRLRERREREAKEEEESQCPRAWEYDKQCNEYYEILWIWFVQFCSISRHFMEGSLLEWKGRCPRCWSLQWSGELVPASLYKINSTGSLEDPAPGERAWERSEKRKEAARKREKKENWGGSSCDTIGSVCFGWKYKGIGRTANRRPIQGRCVHG